MREILRDRDQLRAFSCATGGRSFAADGRCRCGARAPTLGSLRLPERGRFSVAEIDQLPRARWM